MKGKNYNRNIRTGNPRINALRRETTDGEVLHRWLLAGVRKLMPASLFLYGYRIHIKTGGKLPSGSYFPMINKETRNLTLRWESYSEIGTSSSESPFITPYATPDKPTIPGGWQRFRLLDGSVEVR
ncbi:MAG: hypothetical protein WCP32_18175 [Bacteroidota bacterium]